MRAVGSRPECAFERDYFRIVGRLARLKSVTKHSTGRPGPGWQQRQPIARRADNGRSHVSVASGLRRSGRMRSLRRLCWADQRRDRLQPLRRRAAHRGLAMSASSTTATASLGRRRVMRTNNPPYPFGSHAGLEVQKEVAPWPAHLGTAGIASSTSRSSGVAAGEKTTGISAGQVLKVEEIRISIEPIGRLDGLVFTAMICARRESCGGPVWSNLGARRARLHRLPGTGQPDQPYSRWAYRVAAWAPFPARRKRLEVRRSASGAEAMAAPHESATSQSGKHSPCEHAACKTSTTRARRRTNNEGGHMSIESRVLAVLNGPDRCAHSLPGQHHRQPCDDLPADFHRVESANPVGRSNLRTPDDSRWRASPRNITTSSAPVRTAPRLGQTRWRFNR